MQEKDAIYASGNETNLSNLSRAIAGKTAKTLDYSAIVAIPPSRGNEAWSRK
jgi:hypothetical protein